ncbi:MAG: hypothetical protein GY711_08550 [bacterium]|nr:hypothetical protein [bacterium]
MNQPPKVKVFVEGRYRKLTRDLPQTVFFCPVCKGHPRRRRNCEKCEGYGKLSRDSVQELIGWVLGKAFGTRKHKFHGSGREDVDVRMLGRGRPFVMELIGPKVTRPDLAVLEGEVNRRNEGRLEVEGLHWTEKARVRVLKETKHAKRYRALVSVSEAPDPARVEALLGQRVTLQQETPERVAHRRADLVRQRWIEYHAIEAASEPGTVEVTAVTEHGTYFKEAISGEAGRSKPSFGELLGGIDCHCETLDVLAILDEQGSEDEDQPPATGRSMSFGAGL